MRLIPSIPYLFLGTILSCLAASARDESPVQADEIVVSETRLLERSHAPSHVSLDAFAPPAVQSLDDLSTRIANFHISASGAGSYGGLFTYRGLTNTPYFSDPSITLYYDDIPLASSFTYPVSLFGFTSATLHRGPQGTAFGRGGEGGVIVFESAPPADVATGELHAGLGNYSSLTAALTAQTAQHKSFDANVSATFTERDGYIKNTQLGTRVDDSRSSAVSARLRYRPDIHREFTLQFLGSHLHNGAQPLVPLGGPLYRVARGREGQTVIDFAGAAFKAAFDLPIGRLSATTSYTGWALDPYDNRLVLPPPLDSSLAQRQRAWNEEIRLVSDAAAARAWTAGAWFSNTHTTGQIERSIPGLFPIEASSFEADAQTVALFGELALFSDRDWLLVAGLRAESVNKDFDRRQTVPGPGRFVATRAFNSLLPKVSARYDISSVTTASIEVAGGLKTGGWSAFTDNANLAGFEPERLFAIEAGFDTAFTDQHVTLSAHAFTYFIRNYQIERSFNATDYLVVNAPRARSTGAEIEIEWHPLPEWEITASAGLTNVTLREFTDPITRLSYAGRRAPYTPEGDARLALVYQAPTGYFAGIDYVLIGKTYYDETENSSFAQETYTVLNTRLGYDTTHWRVTLYSENLAQKRYASSIIPGVGHVVPSNPRTFGVECVLKW